MSDYKELCERLMDTCVEDLHGYAAVKVGQLLGEAAEALEALQARLDAAYAAMRTDWRDLVQENDALRAKLEALQAHKAAKAAIDFELGIPEDGCNNTQATLTAIRLLHSAHRDDVGANNRLVAFLSESVRMIEGYMRAGWLTNPAAREQATDFIQRARLAYSAPPALPENK